MVLRILEEKLPLDEVLFFDTGMEFDSIYRNEKKMKQLLKDRGVKYTKLSSKYSFLFDMFVRPVKYRDSESNNYPYHYGYGWCGQRGIRWGTTGKLSAIRNHYKDNYPECEIVEYVGIAIDENERANKESRSINVHKKYPLIEWNMTEQDCLQYCFDNGWNWLEGDVELYDILDRVSCWCCQNKNLKELKNIYMYLPEYWQRLRGIQSRIDTPMKGVGKSVFDLEERFKKEIEENIKVDAPK